MKCNSVSASSRIGADGNSRASPLVIALVCIGKPHCVTERKGCRSAIEGQLSVFQGNYSFYVNFQMSFSYCDCCFITAVK